MRPALPPLQGGSRGALRRCLPPIGAFAAAFAVTVAVSGRDPAPHGTVARETAVPARTWSPAALRRVDPLPHLRRDRRIETTTPGAARGGGDPVTAVVVEPAPVTAAAPAEAPQATAPHEASPPPPAPTTLPTAPATAPAVVQPAPRRPPPPPASDPAPSQPPATFDSSGGFDSSG